MDWSRKCLKKFEKLKGNNKVGFCKPESQFNMNCEVKVNNFGPFLVSDNNSVVFLSLKLPNYFRVFKSIEAYRYYYIGKSFIRWLLETTNEPTPENKRICICPVSFSID